MGKWTTAARIVREAMDSAGAALTDAQALTAREIYPRWQPGTSYAAGTRLRMGSGLYAVAQDVVSQAHQPPDAEGMLAIYRPIAAGHAGTAADPIPWIYGMDCAAWLYYKLDGTVYLCKGAMAPCVWAPGTPGLWQWEAAGTR